MKNLMTDHRIRTAVAAWLSDAAAAETTFGNISTWETGGVTDMSRLFSSDYDAAAVKFNDDISAWDTSSVTDMHEMFRGASAFNGYIGDWLVDSVKDMHGIFWGASAFDQDLGWCANRDVELADAFKNTQCESTSCGVARKDETRLCPGTSAAIEGSLTCLGISLADAETNFFVYASAVANVYNVDVSKVIVTFLSVRRRLQSGSDVVVDYTILYGSAAAAAAAVASAASHTANDFSAAIQSAAAGAGVSSVFAGLTVEAVAVPVATTTSAGGGSSTTSSSASGGGDENDDGLAVSIIIVVVGLLVVVALIGAYLYLEHKMKDKADAKVAPVVGPVVRGVLSPDAPPEYWDEVSDPSVAERFAVKPGSDEYGRVSTAFMLTLDRSQFTIHSIERVQNMELWETYAPKMSSILAHEKDEEARKKMVRNWLFHGCPSDVVPKIVQQGFNRSFCGANATLYGKGVYFARDASYSTYPLYCRPDAEGIQTCFLVRAAVGEWCKAKRDDITPGVRDEAKNILYDSTVDDLQNPSIFVLYHDAQTYPEYIVRFSQTWDPDNPKPHPRAGLPAHPNYRPNMLDQSTLARQMSWRAWA